MLAFRKRLREVSGEKAGRRTRRWVYVPYDQLTDSTGPLAKTPPSELGIVLIESKEKAARRPYHKQKLAWILASQRHFALEQAARGVQVRYEVGSYAEVLSRVATVVGRLDVMRPAERELRIELEPLVRSEILAFQPHEGFLSTRDDFRSAVGTTPPWRMDAFYKYMRRRTGILMEGDEPAGGRYSFDTENRKRWKGAPPAPELPTFAVDDITTEVGALIERAFVRHPGELRLDRIPARLEDVERHWAWALEHCLPAFGPYEDAMSMESATLFHSCVSPLLNLHRLLPARVVRDVAQNESLPLASREGFVRQVLGWREFVRHVHEETDGFRRSNQGGFAEKQVGDGGYGTWKGEPWQEESSQVSPFAGADPSELKARLPIFPAFWGKQSGLQCLDHVVGTVWRDGFSHHITRLMVLSNIATLLAIRPRDLADWFWVAYIDAFDWVVEPNVLAMGTFGVGEMMTTKPYVSGAAYLHKMSDYCETCAFDPKGNCPLTRLYWAFLGRHAERFARNPRTSGPVASWRKRSPEERAMDVAVFERVAQLLSRGEVVRPENSSR